MFLEFIVMALSGIQFILLGASIFSTLLTDACVPLGLMQLFTIILETSTFVIYINGYSKRRLQMMTFSILLLCIASCAFVYKDQKCYQEMQSSTPVLNVFVCAVTTGATAYVFIAFVCLCFTKLNATVVASAEVPMGVVKVSN